MSINGPLARAARALVQLPRGHVAQQAGIEEAALAGFETATHDLDDAALDRLRHALEQGGAVFLPEDGDGGVGVRLKFTARDVRALGRLEGEGGVVGADDV